MASSNHSTEETCDLDEERAGRSIIVSNIPPGVSVGELTIHFQQGRNGGGDVENVSLMKQCAVITFEKPEVARKVVRTKQKLKNGEALQLQPYKSKQDGSEAKVFSKVTAQLEFDTLPMKPENVSLLMDAMTSETKVTCHEASYAFIISGSFQEIQNAREYLLNHLRGKRAQNLQPSKPSVNYVDRTQGGAVDESKGSDLPDPCEGNLKPESYETSQQFRDYFRRKYEEDLEEIEKNFNISIQWDAHGVVILNPNPTCKPQMFREASESFCNLYQKVHKTFTRLRLPDDNSSIAREKYGEILKICKKFAILIERSKDRAFFEMFGEEKFLDAAVSKIREIVPIQMESSAASGGNMAQAQASSSRQSESRGHGLLEIRLPGDVKLSVHRGDITEERVDVIVNPANEWLAHGAGVAEAIQRKGGYIINKESRDIISRRGYLNTGDAVTTRSGNLPCKYVVHAVGPEWKKEGPDRSRKILKRACLNSFKEAEEAEADSIALPAIGSGIYGMPKKVCAAVMFDAVEEYSRSMAQGFVVDVRFVNIDSETVEIFNDEFLKRYASGQGAPSSPSGQNEKSHDQGTQSVTGKPNNNRRDRSRVKRSSGSGHDSRQKSGDDHRTPRGDTRKSNQAHGHQEHHHSSSVDETSATPGRSYSEVAGSSRLGLGGHMNDPLGAAEVKKSEDGDRENECPICLDTMKQPKGLKNCKHKFCKACIDEALKHKNRCPVCQISCGAMKGNQPPGSMTHTAYWTSLPGFRGHGTIVIDYNFRSGIQTSEHPNPGQRYDGTSRRAYLPDTSEGREVLQLLKKAFDAHLVFTVGTSATTGRQNQVTWNDIHHKTSTSGGPTCFGYPDPTYLSRVKEELAAKGIK